MKKILMLLLGLLLIGGFFFIGYNEKEQNNAQTIVKQNVEKKVYVPIITQKTNELDNTKVKKSFNSNINRVVETSTKTFINTDKKELESKTQQELQKDLFLDIQTRMMKEMKLIPTCLENAQNKQEALACNHKLQNIQREFELLLGINTDDTRKKMTYEFVWNETTKEKMITELDAGIEPMQKMFSCLQSSDNSTEQEKCFE